MAQKTQTDAVIEAMERNGGYSTLKHLYEHVLTIRDVEWATKTPFASMRRIVQNPRFFFKIRPGLWALNSHRNRLPPSVTALIDARGQPSNDQEKYRHYYYQGIIAELGNLKNLLTYVPAQDKNKPFLDRTLAGVAKTTEMPCFTYPGIVNRVRSIDVVWFNARNLPDSVFEVEYSTDFQNALGKFDELQDFNTKMIVVAPAVRRRQYDDVVSRSLFREVRNRVNFWDCDTAEKVYQKLSEAQAMGLGAVASRDIEVRPGSPRF